MKDKMILKKIIWNKNESDNFGKSDVVSLWLVENCISQNISNTFFMKKKDIL